MVTGKKISNKVKYMFIIKHLNWYKIPNKEYIEFLKILIRNLNRTMKMAWTLPVTLQNVFLSERYIEIL